MIHVGFALFYTKAFVFISKIDGKIKDLLNGQIEVFIFQEQDVHLGREHSSNVIFLPT